jgi:hypothetical protein
MLRFLYMKDNISEGTDDSFGGICSDNHNYGNK